MLNISLDKEGFVFGVCIDGKELEFSQWPSTDDCIYYFPLSTLVDNGNAFVRGTQCVVPFENIYLIDYEDRKLLGIPPDYNKAMRLRGEGTLNLSDFKYKLEYLTHVPDGDMLNVERRGNVIMYDGRRYLLSDYQYELVRTVDEFNALGEDAKTPEHNFRKFGYIKELALKSGCELCSYLQNENVYVPEKIKIELGHDEDGYSLEPSIPIEENEKFKHTFDRMRRVQNVYPLQKDDGERIRVVVNDEQKSNLDYIKKTGGRRRTREEIEDIVRRPTEYFNPDEFDLSELYSDRVIEIGVYKPVFYPFVSPYKSCWIAGAKVQTKENGTSKILIRNEQELSSLRNAIADAEERKHDIVRYDESSIGIDDARFLADTAEKQLKSADKPIKTDDDGEKPERRVLIIKENDEAVNYSEKKDIAEKEDLYTLYSDPFLCSAFSLKEHQKEGVAWLQYLYNSKAGGCLMADDMGLGKTLQILYFIDWHSRNNPGHKPYLIVAPVSLLENWESEYERFFMSPRMQVKCLTSGDVPRRFDRSVVERMQKMDVILTSYESMRISQLNFCAVEFDVVVLDEAQKIKSLGTMVTSAAKALKGNFKIALTGTPVENSLMDLWSIMDFCVPGLLGNAKEFARQYINPLKNADTDIVKFGNEVHRKLGVYFIRRLKKDVISDLPQKIELKDKEPMPAVQDKTYCNVIDAYNEGDGDNMLVTITDLRTISEHPYVYDSSFAEHDCGRLVETSARLKLTVKYLDDIRQRNEKVIIFAERKDTQKMLQKVCFGLYGIAAKIINGDTPSIVRRTSGNRQSRQSAINEFQAAEGFNIIIMSPIAAGMGLNITGANHVIHYSRHWNPAKESQATDRAYRIGQTKDVFVYYPMATNKKFTSFDETLDELLSRKTSLASSTIFPTEKVEVTTDEMASVLFGKQG